MTQPSNEEKTIDFQLTVLYCDTGKRQSDTNFQNDALVRKPHKGANQ